MPVKYVPQRRTESAVKWLAAALVVALAALFLTLAFGYQEIQDARCFRQNQAQLARIGSEDRKVQDQLFAGQVHTLSHPSPDGLQQLLDQFAAYRAARARDDKERAAHPVTGKC